MTIVLFVLDTSSSMNQRAVLQGTSRLPLLDIAKQAVERIIKQRQGRIECRNDRYMLMTLEEPPFNIKSGWKDSLEHFKNELKNLKPSGTTPYGAGLKNVFDYLNNNRLASSVDNYGNGRVMHYNEFAFIITITDGSKFTNMSTATFDLQIPSSKPMFNQTNSGIDLTIEPYRWDQRLFSLILKLPSVDIPSNGKENFCDNSSLENMCFQTGGRSYCITNRSSFYNAIDNLHQRCQNGLMVKFQRFEQLPLPTPNPQQQFIECTNFIPIRNKPGYSFGNWPIPEAYWVDQSTQIFPPRTAHPVFKLTCVDSVPSFMDNLPFDKIELESSPLTKLIVSRNSPTTAWQLFVSNSQRNSELGQPFGYIKSSTQHPTVVNMFILPYNYPMLFPLLEELFKGLQGKPTREWRIKFDSYLRSTPSYYMPHLKKALGKMGAPNLIPEGLDIMNSFAANLQKRLKHNAKMEQEHIINMLCKPKPFKPSSLILKPYQSRFLGETISNPNVAKAFQDCELKDPTLPMNALKPFFIDFKTTKKTFIKKKEFYLKLTDIPTEELEEQCNRLQQILKRKNPLEMYIQFQERETIHHMSLSKMGDYQEANKSKLPELREIEPAAQVRQNAFGNPFKNKKQMADIDEVDLMDENGMTGNGMNGNTSSFGGSQPPKGKKRSADLSLEPRKRKPSYLQFKESSISDILFNVIRTPESTPPSSPVHKSNPMNGQTTPPQQSFSISTFDGYKFSEPTALLSPVSSTGSESPVSAGPPNYQFSVLNGDGVPVEITNDVNYPETNLNAVTNKRPPIVLPHKEHSKTPTTNGNILQNNCKPRYESPFSRNGHYDQAAYILDTYTRRRFRVEEFDIKSRCITMFRNGSEDHSDLLKLLASMDDADGFKHYLLLEVVSAALRFRKMSVLRALLNDQYFGEEMKKIVQVNKISVN